MSRKRAVGCRSTVAGSNPGGRAALPCGEAARGRKDLRHRVARSGCYVSNSFPSTRHRSALHNRRSRRTRRPILVRHRPIDGIYASASKKTGCPRHPVSVGTAPQDSCSDITWAQPHNGDRMPGGSHLLQRLVFDARAFRKILRDERADILRAVASGDSHRGRILFAANFRFDPSPFRSA